MASTLFFALHALALLALYAAGLDRLFTWLLFLLLLGTFGLGLYDLTQREHSLRRNFPLFARARWLAEYLRPFVRQYLLESDMDGAPINRMFRSIVYQRAKGDLDTIPFGTRVDTHHEGYEWIGHSIAALNLADLDKNPRVRIGGPDCTRPYEASLLNVSAMSYGALSANAVRALNKGSQLGGFYQNTGEGGLSDYHRAYDGDLTWQIGTGYFGCRNPDGSFSSERFADTAALDAVRMIEVKLSQGAKPGHGGILPASKNGQIIARIRGVEPHTEVVSPSAHTAFDSPRGLLEFIAQLRTLAAGKPVGFKLCVGRESEFIAICKAMVETGIKPDFITVDGGEGGTGAAPLEYSNSVGMPLRDGLAFVVDCLIGFGLRDDIRVIASGKLITAFHLAKALALGADLCNSARGMMLALGCVQSLVCNTNRCPTGVTTQDPRLTRGLDVEDKGERVARYQRETVHALLDMVSSAGLRKPGELNRSHIYRRVDAERVARYDALYPYPGTGDFLHHTVSGPYAPFIEEASSDCFLPRSYVFASEA
ncbi:FMN-binding glutamate synthase family protein [Pseudohaliea rubra]|uniref:Ferredoxin-dependent glutamate synthase n=1 Tax=Pseudohaliea rubra DSM 19751 TaxID=1265313 RepID=A0A095WW73_9GAMM|nr:FMN-binding glutamate synthase family protein [Pseudohaliea rubra]KGE02899.1 Ferredoxin-dependent glutamate synthase [Pseudohaliea rubra DSM 19751]